MLAFLPFEKAFYDKFNVPCRFIGHTMADAMPLDPDKGAARDRLGIPHSVRCLALLPGSRGAEVEMLSADFLKTAQLLRATYPDLQVVVPLVNAKRREQFERIKAETAPGMIVHMLDGQARDAMIASDAALLASGTAALECMLAKCPMVVGYRMKPFTFWLAKRLVKPTTSRYRTCWPVANWLKSCCRMSASPGAGSRPAAAAGRWQNQP